ncbi:FKBP-type peptidyl-prolyl cis-trans isomerase [bacterium]|nr:FKBP-type peptidyl-prolyl cis-trans isomerase [bacterium]
MLGPTKLGYAMIGPILNFLVQGVPMKSALLLSAALVTATPLLAETTPTSVTQASPSTNVSATSFNTDIEKRSYAIGMTIADSFKTRTEFDGIAIANGFRDAIKGKTLLTDDEKQEIIVTYQNEIQARREKEFQSTGDKNAEEGKAFLAANKGKPDVITTASGLQYKVVTTGTGKVRKSPKATDTVTVHYKGTLIDGTEFDSSYKRNQPASFPLSGVIKGWTEGLQKMKTGDKFIFYIPSELAYGTSSAGLIGPNSTLIFEVELLSIGTK